MSLFKRLFGIRKASKNAGDTKIDFDVKDIKKGYILDYDLKSWEVEDVAVYTWDNGAKDYEYTLSSNGKEYFINYEVANGKLSVYWEGAINAIWPEARKNMRTRANMEDLTFEFEGKSFYFYGEGSARVKSTKETYDMQNWLYESEDQEVLISFNKYEDGSMDAYIGKHLPSHAISNILPR